MEGNKCDALKSNLIYVTLSIYNEDDWKGNF